jgi:hypothetical protein
MRPTWRRRLPCVPTSNGAEDDVWPPSSGALRASQGFFFLIRQACRLRVYSTLRAAEVWKECDVDDDADANVAAAALEAAETKVQYVQ